ncbi:MAG: DUF3592 domain-containing protein [Chloroflexota bacterium]
MQKKTPTGKELILATGIVAIFISVIAIVASLVGNQAIRQRNEEGVIVSATVTDKRFDLVSSGRGSSRVNTFTVIYFEETAVEMETVDLGDGLEIELPKVGEIGDIYSTDIQRVSDEVFTTTREGDDIEIIYLASDPERAWIAQDVADVSYWNGAVFIATLFAAGILLVFVSFRMASRASNP